jgi:ribosome-interacting GTPase 1
MEKVGITPNYCLLKALMHQIGINIILNYFKGRGRQVIAVARTCNLIFMVLDVLKPLHHKKLLEHELEGFGLRLNKQPPNISYKRKDKGNLFCWLTNTKKNITLHFVQVVSI